jgi:hypothetical protein
VFKLAVSLGGTESLKTRSEYDDAGARKALAKSIKAHAAKLAELDELRQAIEKAEAKHAAVASPARSRCIERSNATSHQNIAPLRDMARCDAGL